MPKTEEDNIIERFLTDRISYAKYLLPGLHTNRLIKKLSRLSAQKIARVKSRDAIMCNNLEYLYKVLYPGKKIIVWAHNAHLQNNPKRMGGFPPLRPTTYSIGLFAVSGKGAYNDRTFYQLKPAPKNSIEALAGNSKSKIAFLDLLYQKATPNNSWIFEKFGYKYWDGQYYNEIIRNKFDGLIFIKNITPPNYLD